MYMPYFLYLSRIFKVLVYSASLSLGSEPVGTAELFARRHLLDWVHVCPSAGVSLSLVATTTLQGLLTHPEIVAITLVPIRYVWRSLLAVADV